MSGVRGQGPMLTMIAVVGAAVLSAQSPTGSGATFEVASVKPNKSGSNRVNIDVQPGGRFTATNVSAMDLIAIAYGDGGAPFVRSAILDGPSWLGRDRFDIVAKASGDPTQAEVVRMIRPLLAERFRLSAHTETRERPIYVLTIARRDGQLGPSIRRSTLDCTAPRHPNDAPPDGCEMLNVPGTAKLRGSPLSALAHMMVGWVDDHRDVRDETGLEGRFDVDLRWTPTQAPANVPRDLPADAARAIAAIDPNGPSLFTAIQEQLGLRLVPDKDASIVLVIDHVEPPTPD